MTAKFHIPDFWKHCDLNLNLLDLMKEHPEYFRDVEIVSAYGCFAPALWNGGRVIVGSTSRDVIKWTISEFNKRGVPIRYTFTNPTLTEADLKDHFCNMLCRLANNGLNEIIINAPFLEEYIREKYPAYPLTSSTVKQIEDYDLLMKEFEKDYKLVVLDYNWNNDFEKLDKIPMELRKRCEILINPYCVPHCQRRGEHYRVLGRCQRRASEQQANLLSSFNRGLKQQENPMQEAIEFNCKNPSMDFNEVVQYKTFITNDQLFDKYLSMGFDNFKIEGRVLDKKNVVESYVYYLAKPEFGDVVRESLMNAPSKMPEELTRPKRYFVDYDGKEIPQKD